MVPSLLAVAAVGAAGYGSHRQWSRQEFTVAAEKVSYRRTGHGAQSLPTRMIVQPVLLHQPEPQVILWSERRPPILVQGLTDEREGAELVEKLQLALERWRPVVGRDR